MKRFAILLAGTAFVTPALAADVVYEEPPAPIAVTAVDSGWTGLYIGIQGGGAFNTDDPEDLAITPSFGANTAVPGLSAGANSGFGAGTIGAAFGNNFESDSEGSFIGGANIGYDYQIDNFVVGALVDVNGLDISQTQSAFSNTPAFYTAERDLDLLATARLRAGYLVTPSALAYVTGGVAYGDVDYSFFTNSPAVNPATPAVSFEEDDDDFGYTVGGGMEVKVTDNVSFGAEYLYTNLGDDNPFTRLNGGPFDGNATAGSAAVPGAFTDFTSTGDFDFHTVTAKLSYRFN